MGNIGRSSTGCATCRKRKIKCDENRPGCRKCAQVRKECPGYPHQIQLGLILPPENEPPKLPVFVPSTGLGTPSVQPGNDRHKPIEGYAPYQKTAFLPTPIAHDSTVKPPAVGSLPAEAYLPLPTTAFPPTPSQSSSADIEIKHEEKDALVRTTAPNHDDHPESPPKYDIQHQSICFFVHLFCFQGAKLYSFPVIDFVPYILQNASPTSSVTLAAAAVSRMTLADQYSGTDVRLQTGHDYSRALTSTFASIRNPSSAVADSTILAVWLLGLYEAINSVLSHGRTSGTTQPTRTPAEEWQSHISHIRGAMHLLRLRGATQFTHPRSEKIFRVFKAAIQMRLFILNSVTSQDFGDLELDIYQDEHEFVPSQTANNASAFFLRIARLTEEIKHFILSIPDRSTDDNNDKEKSRTSLTAQQFIALGESVDNAMTGWADIEPGWQMMRIRPPLKGVTTAWSLYPNHALYYFYSFWVYLYWIRFLIARIKLYEALIALLNVDRPPPPLPLVKPLNPSPHRPSSTSSPVKTIQLSTYITIIQLTASQIIGLTAYALGDVANTGNFNSSVSAVNPGGGTGMQEMNVVAAMQLVIPLKSLLRSEYMTGPQRGAIDLAVVLIGDGYRRRPGGGMV